VLKLEKSYKNVKTAYCCSVAVPAVFAFENKNVWQLSHAEAKMS